LDRGEKKTTGFPAKRVLGLGKGGGGVAARTGGGGQRGKGIGLIRQKRGKGSHAFSPWENAGDHQASAKKTIVRHQEV